jgi:hypothetical protein
MQVFTKWRKKHTQIYIYVESGKNLIYKLLREFVFMGKMFPSRALIIVVCGKNFSDARGKRQSAKVIMIRVGRAGEASRILARRGKNTYIMVYR